MQYGKEEAFFHITCQNYLNIGDRVPDLRRCERIRWVKKFIENHKCKNLCNNCSGILVWEKPYKNTTRVHIMLKEEKYIAENASY